MRNRRIHSPQSSCGRIYLSHSARAGITAASQPPIYDTDFFYHRRGPTNDQSLNTFWLKWHSTPRIAMNKKSLRRFRQATAMYTAFINGRHSAPFSGGTTQNFWEGMIWKGIYLARGVFAVGNHRMSVRLSFTETFLSLWNWGHWRTNFDIDFKLEVNTWHAH